MTLNELINKLVAIKNELSTSDMEIFVDNTLKVQNVEIGVGNNGNQYCNIVTKAKK